MLKRLIIVILVCIFSFQIVCFASKNYYLDDVVAEYKNEGKRIKRTEKLKYDYEIISVLVVKNSDWTDCPLSNSFLDKYNNKSSIINDYNVIKVSPVGYDRNKVIGQFKNNKLLLDLVLDNQKKMPCIFYVIRNANDEVDDILTYIVPEDKMSLSYEEMYGLAFNE